MFLKILQCFFVKDTEVIQLTQLEKALDAQLGTS